VIVVPIIFIIVNKIIEYFILINIGAELNMIIINVINKPRLAMKTRVKIKILLYSKYISRFLEMIENVLISIDLIVCRVNIFITQSVSQSLILKISYLYFARVQLLFNDDSM